MYFWNIAMYANGRRLKTIMIWSFYIILYIATEHQNECIWHTILIYTLTPFPES